MFILQAWFLVDKIKAKKSYGGVWQIANSPQSFTKAILNLGYAIFLHLARLAISSLFPH